MNKNIELSLIISMYNSEKYISECIDSILKQTLSSNKFEVICIDDGSTDSTMKICLSYALKYEHIRLLNADHHGVSHARNIGIDHARGQYVAFLDSDDMLSPQTLENILQFINSYQHEIDVVTYDTSYACKDKLYQSKRNKLVESSQLIDLNANPYISITRINIIAKKEILPRFNENLEQYEDQCFLNEILLQKCMVGYCKEALYIYRQYADSTVKRMSHQYYCFDFLMDLFSLWLEKFKESRGFNYIKCLILYDLSWRLREDKILPYHYSKDKFEESYLKYQNIINQIDNILIANHPFVVEQYKEYFFLQKTLYRPIVTFNNEEWTIEDTDHVYFKELSILCVIKRIGINDGKICFMGFFKSPVISFISKPVFYAIINDNQVINIPLYDSSESNFQSKARTNSFFGFTIEFSLDDVRKIFFYIEIEQKGWPLEFWFTDINQISTQRKQNFYFSKLGIEFLDNAFFIRKASEPIYKKHRREYLLSLSEKHSSLRMLITYSKNLFNKKNIWLYSDIEGIIDNAYWQFKHDYYQNDNIERYFIYNGDLKTIQHLFTDEEFKNVVKHRSKKHKQLFICCSLILTSFSQSYFYIPFKNKDYYAIMSYIKLKVIYLQHGIMHAKIPFLYAKDMSLVDKIVVSTQFEFDNAISILNYSIDDIVPCGMSRFDKLKKNKTQPQRRFLYAPSWRRWLVDQDVDKWFPVKDFEQSEFYHALNSILTNKDLISFLDTTNSFIDIQLHPIMSMYRDKFCPMHKRINLIDNAEIENYSLLISDFSSFIYDFIYLNIPVLFFFPDREKFNAGMHSYRELFISLEDSFGPYTETIEDMISELINIYRSGFDIHDKYKKRYANLFFKKGTSHCSDIYHELMK